MADKIAIVFLRNYKVKDAEGLEYHKGCIYAVPHASARHFIKRGAAEYIDIEPPEEFEEEEVEEGDDVKDLPSFNLPVHKGGGMWELPDGRTIRGKKKAFEAWQAGRTLDDPPLEDVEIDKTLDPIVE